VRRPLLTPARRTAFRERSAHGSRESIALSRFAPVVVSAVSTTGEAPVTSTVSVSRDFHLEVEIAVWPKPDHDVLLPTAFETLKLSRGRVVCPG